MSVNKKEIGKKEELQTRLLPKNYRQIGEPGSKKIYIEDYVYTYLNRMAQPGNLYSRGAILFGKTYRTAAGTCLFISGAMSCQSIEFDLEETVFSEEVWNEIYRVRDTWFPGLEICGWFLSRMGFSVELNDKIIRIHMDNFNGENKVLYMMDVLENEDAFYQFENYSLRKQKGYYIYYESNHEMADYMLAEGQGDDMRKTANISSELRRDSSVVRNYKNTLQKKKSGKQEKLSRWSPLTAAGAAMIIVALAYGIYSVNDFRQQQRAEAVFNQTDPSLDRLLSDQEEDTREESTREAGTEEADTKETDKKEADTGETGETKKASDETETISDRESNQDADRDSDRGNDSDDAGDTDVFTQEDPDDVVESWAYIGGEYTVKKGDTLASISKEIYDSYDYIQKIADENNIENINQIYPGQVLKIPLIND